MIVREEYFPVMWLYFVQGVSNLKTLNDILRTVGDYTSVKIGVDLKLCYTEWCELFTYVWEIY